MPKVEIVYALAQRAIAQTYELRRGASVADALQLAAADPRFADVDIANAAVGVYGRIIPRDAMLQDGDRLEIYRPLLEDAKLARRRRANSKLSKSGRS